MTEKYILVGDDEYCYTLDTSDENYKTLEDFEKQEFEDAKHDGIDIKEYEDDILQLAHDKYWDWVYDNYLEADAVNDIMNALVDENEQLKQSYKEFEDECQSTFNAMNRKQNDLYRKNFKLKEENKQLKEQLEICKDARQAYKQDWKACVSYCDTYKDEIHTLKDNIQGLIEENKELKSLCKVLIKHIDEKSIAFVIDENVRRLLE